MTEVGKPKKQSDLNKKKKRDGWGQLGNLVRINPTKTSGGSPEKSNGVSVRELPDGRNECERQGRKGSL